ncbi:hypothetical protein WA158_008004 [Blastocystis sp. Blastoise]
MFKSFVTNHKLLTTLGVCIAASSTPLIKKDNRVAFKETLDGVSRGFKLTKTVAFLAIDYKWSFRGLTRGSQAYMDLSKIVNKRESKRVAATFLDLGGVFVKCGQMISSGGKAIPKEWTNTMSVCQDKAEGVPFSDVARVFKEDFGLDANDLFSEIDQVPVGAASLAQVHHAVLKTGEEVAVKIQYPHLKKQLKQDINNVERLSRIIAKMFPSFDLMWMVPMMRKELERETDFTLEGKNAQDCKEYFASHKDIYIPTIYPEISSKRVLVMEYINGVKINDPAVSTSMGYNIRDVSKSFVRAFAEMIFVYGHVHIDPHAGNLLVRPSPSNPKQYQVVIIDHGMYYHLDKDFQTTFCKLWQASILKDKKTLHELCVSLHMEALEFILPIMFMGQSMDSEKKIGEDMDRKDFMKLHNTMMKHQDPMEMLNAMKNMPEDFKFCMRTIQMMNGLNHSLGGSNSDRLYVMTDASQKGLDLHNVDFKQYNITSHITHFFHYLQLRIKLAYLDIVLPIMKYYMKKQIEAMEKKKQKELENKEKEEEQNSSLLIPAKLE